MEIVGEGAARISDDTKTVHPRIPWPDIVGFRNWGVHVYSDIDLDVVWKVVNEDFPSLIRELERIVPPEAR